MTQFQIIDTQIYDPEGNEFIAKGTNMFAWEGTSRVDSIVTTWGFNTVRVPNFLLGSYGQPHPNADEYRTNQRIVEAFTQGYPNSKTVVMFDAHDRVGRYYQGDDLAILKDYWREMAQLFKDNPYVWFNLHNEPGRKISNPDQWVDYHRELIDIIRAEGADNIIVVDGEAWGQDFHSQTILNHGQKILDHHDNILFSIHVYDQWNDSDVGHYFDQLHDRNIPVIVGEYGSKNGDRSTLPASAKMMEAAQDQEIGRIVWVFSANDANDLTTLSGGHGHHFDGSNPEVLTDLGQLVWRDLQRSENLSSYPSMFCGAGVEMSVLALGVLGIFLLRQWNKRIGLND